MNWCFLWKLHIDHNNAYIGGPKKMAKLLERHIIEIACKNYIKFLTTFFQHISIFTQYLCKTIGLPNVEMAVTWKLYVKTSNIVNTSNNSSVWYALWTAVIKQLPGWSVVLMVILITVKYNLNPCIAHHSCCKYSCMQQTEFVQRTYMYH